VRFPMVGHIAFGHPITMACAAVVIQSFLVNPLTLPAAECSTRLVPEFLPTNVDARP